MMFDNKIIVDRYYYTLKEALEFNNYFQLYVNGVNTAYGVPMGLSEIVGSMIPNAQYSGSVSFEDNMTRTLFTNYLWPEFQNATVAYIDKEHGFWEESTEPDLTDMRAWFTEHGPLWLRWLRESKERYEPLITSFETIKDNLLGPVKVVSTASGSYSGTVTGSGTNTGTVQVGESTNSTTTVASSNVRKESDTPQDGIQSLTDGYISKAAQETGNSTTTLAGSGTTTTTNNLANSNSSTNSGNNTENSTVSNDFNTPIERFREIQEKLHNLYADWADEFSKFVLQSAD